MPWLAECRAIFARFVGTTKERDLNRAVVQHWITGGLHLHRMLGSYPVGMIALEAHFTDQPEVTAEYVTARLGGYLSDDTIRRRLRQMQKAGVLSCRKIGRVGYYRMNPQTAAAAIAYMKGEVANHPKSSAHPQVAE